jgi:hypothetical protein
MERQIMRYEIARKTRASDTAVTIIGDHSVLVCEAFGAASGVRYTIYRRVVNVIVEKTPQIRTSAS